MTDPRPRLTMENAQVGTKVVCVNGSVSQIHPETGGTYTVWTVADFATYAVLCRPDGSAAARFHVIAEAHAAARAINNAHAQGAGGDET